MIYFEKIANLYKINKIVFFKKLTFKIFKIIISLPFFPVSFLIFLLIIVISPFFHIRIGPLPTTRIGHFAQNVDLYLSYKKYKQKKKTLDIFFLENFISNNYLLKIWKKDIIILNKLIFNQIYILILILRLNYYTIPIINSDRDTFNFYSNASIKINIKFSPEEEKLGYNILKKIGIRKSDKFVCLVTRDSYYLNTYHGENDWSYHNYRDVDIKNYYLAAEALTKKGYYVLRMGTRNKKKMVSQNPKIIDYSFSEYKSDFMDIFLPSRCVFYISNGTGPDALPKIFRKPIAWVNIVPVAFLQAFRKDYVYLFKRHYSKTLLRDLTLKEIFKYGVAASLNSSSFKEKKIKLIENSPKEICNVVLELHKMINNKKYLKRDSNNSIFWNIYEENIVKFNFKYLHGTLFGKYSSAFLKNKNTFFQ
jgi:putative glycosyltransferase (TIGR04372 family)